MNIGRRARQYFNRRILSWGRANRRTFPWREESDPFKLLIAEVLLQRSRSKTVAPVFKAVFQKWRGPAELGGARIDTLRRTLRPLGLVRRAEILRALARAVAGIGRVPETLDELTALPGVGRYTAAATLAIAYRKATPVVDSVSARVFRRFFGLSSNRSPSEDAELWKAVEAIAPPRQVREWNWAVLDLASQLCVPKQPRCPRCPLVNQCVWGASTVHVSGSS